MEENKFEIIGGSLEKSLSGETKLDMKALAKESWELTKTQKSEVLQGVVFIFLVAIAFAWVIQSFLGISDFTQAPPRLLIAIKMAGIVITTPIIASLLLLGISHSVGIKPSFILLLKKVMGSLLVILLALAIAALTDLSSSIISSLNAQVGFVVLIYLGMATGFSMMLLVEKNVSPSQTIIQSFKVYNRYILPLSGFYLGAVLAFFLGMFTFGLVYIWLIPFYFNFKGVLYRELFGVRVAKVDSKAENSESTFHA